MTRNLWTLACVLLVLNLSAQELLFKKGVIVDSIPLNDTIPESISLFIPKKFEQNKKWPLLVVLSESAKVRPSLYMFQNGAEEEGYLLASHEQIEDSLSLTESMLRLGNLFKRMLELFPVDTNRIYVAGSDGMARLANLVPFVFDDVDGVISCGATLTNFDLLSKENPFHFIGIVGREDFSFPEMLEAEEVLNKLKFDNNIILFDGGKEWPSTNDLSRAMRYLKLRVMARQLIAKDSAYIEGVYQKDLVDASRLKKQQDYLLLERELKEIQTAFRDLREVDSIEGALRDLRKNKLYRAQNKAEEAALLNEYFLKKDFAEALDDDIRTYNYNNLGWWNYQMTEMGKLVASEQVSTQRMGRRMIGFLNALVEDNIDVIRLQEEIDDEALIFLSMLKTITEPTNFEFYIQVVSLGSKYEDYGTALFYLEEALKNGFKEKSKLYEIEHTALLRISPEFNALIAKYFNEARYEIEE